MKNFNREAIKRMFDGRTGGGGVGSNGADLAGYATQMWVNQNYVSIEFFNRLFSIHGHDPEDESTPPTDISVLPNDTDSIVDSIESMVGFWTEEYLSALGLNSEQGGGGITLNAALASINNSPLGNPTGTNTVLMFNGTTWVYASMGSTDMNTVWNALAAATNQQINISHLATALSGYATTSQLSDYATVTDLEQLASYFNTLSGYFTNGAANEAVKLETARTIWGQQFDGTANITGDISQATCLEFSGIAGTATNGGFIDFHYAGGGADYTSRIIEDVSGVLKINNTIWAQLSGNVSIGTSTISQTYKLDVAGYTKTTRLYLADGVYLEYDSNNIGVHLVGAGFYSDSYVSALGVNSGGGGGGSDYIPLTGSDQIAGSLIPVTTNAYDLGDSTHAWRNIRGNSIFASNSITTYYLTANSTVTAVGSITSTAGNIIASAGYVSAASGFKVTGKDDTYILLAGGGTALLSSIGGGTVSSISLTSGGTSLTPTNGVITFPAATDSEYGIVKVNSVYGQAVTLASSGQGSTRNYGLQKDSTGKAFVYVPWEDTMNTAGATNNGSTKLFLIGATAQSNNPQTYSNLNCYIGSDNFLYSGGSKVLTSISSSDVTTALGFTPAASSDLNNYLPLTGGTVTGNITTNGYTYSIINYFRYNNTNYGYIGIPSSSSNEIAIVTSLSDAHFRFYLGGDYRMIIKTDGKIGIGTNSPLYLLDVNGSVGATSFIKSGGTSSQFLKADGSVDSNTYLTSASLSNYVQAIVVNSEQPVGTTDGVITLSGIVKKIKIGSSATEYTPSSGVVTLPAYPSGFVTGISVNGGTPIEPTSGIVGLTGLATTSDLNNYLPLTGGTVTGNITTNGYTYSVIKYFRRNNTNYGYIGLPSSSSNEIAIVTALSDAHFRFYLGGDYRMIIKTDGKIGIGTNSPSYLLDVNGSVGATSFIKSGGTSSQFLKADGSVDSNTYLTSGDVVTTNTAQSITGSKTFTATLTSSAGGSFTGGLRFYSLCVECASDGTPSSSRYGEINRYKNTLHLQYDSGTGGVTMCRQGFLFTNPGTTSQLSTSNNNLQIAVGTGDAYVDKAWVINSDMRKKDIAQYINIDINSIADAPVFNFTWKNDITKQLTLGSSAQYWQNVLPNAVRRTPDGYLGMDYSSIALASAVLAARKVVDHEARIRLLEVENAALRNEINQLKKVA